MNNLRFSHPGHQSKYCDPKTRYQSPILWLCLCVVHLMPCTMFQGNMLRIVWDMIHLRFDHYWAPLQELWSKNWVLGSCTLVASTHGAFYAIYKVSRQSVENCVRYDSSEIWSPWGITPKIEILKTEYYAPIFGLHLDTIYRILSTKFQGNLLSICRDIAILFSALQKIPKTAILKSCAKHK
jgi:hypothetical protein